MISTRWKIGSRFTLDSGITGAVLSVEAVRGSYLGHTSWEDYLSQFHKIKLVVAYENQSGSIRTEDVYL